MAGTVLEVGKGVQHVKSGDRVFSFDFGNVEGEAGQAIVVVRGNRVGKASTVHRKGDISTRLICITMNPLDSCRIRSSKLHLRSFLPNHCFPNAIVRLEA